jgi:phosphoheptose isomerase
VRIVPLHTDDISAIRDYLVWSRVTTALANQGFTAANAAIVDRMHDALPNGNKVLLTGNAGSASGAPYIGRLRYDLEERLFSRNEAGRTRSAAATSTRL